jgi:hypothetical protein
MALKNASLQATDKSKRTHVFEINSAISKNKILYVQGTLHRQSPFHFTPGWGADAIASLPHCTTIHSQERL